MEHIGDRRGCMNNKMLGILRNVYFLKYRLIKKNMTPCIISRDCIGGVLYKRMRRQFSSPTIKLYMTNEDFVLFCLNITDFLNGSVEEIHTDRSYPVGQIKTEKGSIKLYFMHYNSFSSAKDSWERRKKRINLDNIVVILNAESNVDKNIIEQFEKIPYRKVLLTSNAKESECVKNLKCYERGYDGPLVAYKSRTLPIVRYMDEFDWIGFLKNTDQFSVF